MKKIQFFKEENHLTDEVVYFTRVNGITETGSLSNDFETAQKRFHAICDGKLTEETLLETIEQ